MAFMNTTITIDKAGRVIIPKVLRDEWHLEPGDSLSLEAENGSARLQPVRNGRMVKKGNFWVFKGGGSLTLEMINETIKKMRDERDRRNMFPEG